MNRVQVGAALPALSLVVALLAGSTAAAAGPAAKDLAPPVVRVVGALTVSPEAMMVRALVSDASGAGTVTLWIRQGRAAYTAIPMVASQDGSYVARAPMGGADGYDISYYIEAGDSLGNGPATAGSPASPLRARFAPEAFEPQPSATGRMAACFAFVVLANVYLIVFIRRRDRLDRIRNYWFRVLSPLIHLHGAEIVLAIDRIVSGGPLRAGRLDALVWLNRVRATRPRKSIWPSSSRRKQAEQGADGTPAPARERPAGFGRLARLAWFFGR
jgi:hypothetical protein